MDRSHLDALELNLSHQREYLRVARDANAKALRKVWIAQIEKEIAAEKKFLGIVEEELEMSDDELLAALSK